MQNHGTNASPAENLRGAAFMTIGMFAFTVNDLAMKSFTGQLNLGQVVFIRGAIATILVYFLALKMGQMRPIKLAFRPLLFIRAAGEASATYLFVTALFHIPIANVSAIMQALPLALTFFAAFLFGEKVGWRRYTAVIVGLCGVLLIVRPGLQGFDIYSLYVLGAVVGCVVRDLATRRLASDIPALFITFVTAILVATMGGVIALAEEWKPVAFHHVALMGATSSFLLAGYFFTVTSMRTGDIGFVSPFRYTVLVFSVIGGMLIYSEFPDIYTIIGSLVVVATGIYTLYRERVVHRQRITPAPVRT
ncbi:MAG: DMT family transporter [Nitratireductor sp.]|nr:DMT family transporter [Nitratireductor sp.]MCB1449964.1 DMT family transporter [Nitratireductor sp.]